MSVVASLLCRWRLHPHKRVGTNLLSSFRYPAFTQRVGLSTQHNSSQNIHCNYHGRRLKPYYTCGHFCQSTRNLTESLSPTRRRVGHHAHVIAHVTEIFRQRDTCWTGNTGLAGIRVQEYEVRPFHKNKLLSEARY